MKKAISTFLLLPYIVMAQVNTSSMNQEPIAIKKPHELTIHNHTRNDEYFWMNERDSKQVLDHLAKENAYTTEYFKSLEGLKNNLLNEFESRINPNDVSAPFILNGKTYQMRNSEGKDYQLIYRLEDKKEFLFLDENERAKGKTFYELADWSPSPNNELLALSEDVVGRRKYTITVRQNKGGKFLKDKITDSDGSIVWANDNKTIFYVKKDPQTLREFQVYRHELGTDSKKDMLVYQENDEKFSVHISKTITDKFIAIDIVSSTTSEVRLIDADQPSKEPIVFLNREKGHLYEIEHHEKGFYILSNKNASNRKVVFSSKIPASIDECTEVISHSNNVLIESILSLKDVLVTEIRTNGLLKIQLTDLATRKNKFIEFKEETYFTGLGLNDDYTSNTLFFNYNSMTTPASVYQYDLKTGIQKLWFRKELLDKNFKPEDYESKRIWATANDGAKIPVSIVFKKGTVLSNAPCLLYGYGSYGYTLPDVFSATRLSLLDRGFVYAVAHIRGSKYMGESWYENGKFLKKVNTFTDFINAAEYLGMQGYCDKNKIYAQGGSAGGLLMGAVTNLAPYLWKGVIAQVPFVDVVTTMLDETIPLTVGEYEEWGNPNDEEFYYYMLNYSPYDNVKKMDYPALYITTGYHDSQVQYWEPMKWVAKMRDYRTNQQPLLFDCNMDAGHGGGSGRTQERLELAKEFAFILNLEGIEK
ncbi:MAG: S9 family peptidase [Flavobacteriia bacterium]